MILVLAAVKRNLSSVMAVFPETVRKNLHDLWVGAHTLVTPA